MKSFTKRMVVVVVMFAAAQVKADCAQDCIAKFGTGSANASQLTQCLKQCQK